MSNYDARIFFFQRDFPHVWSSHGLPILSYIGGWDELVWRTVRAMIKADPDVQIEQIKEKYGILQIYHCSRSIEVEQIVQDAGAISATICEYCGSRGWLRHDLSWTMTLCDAHHLEAKPNEEMAFVWPSNHHPDTESTLVKLNHYDDY